MNRIFLAVIFCWLLDFAAISDAQQYQSESGSHGQDATHSDWRKSKSGDVSNIHITVFSFTTKEGYVFDAKIVAPSKAERNGYGVLMLGGGYGNDLDWRVPGFMKIDGKKTQVTISGKTHSDAPLIATSLAMQGYVVMHWTTIRRGDPKRDSLTNTYSMYSIKDLLRFSKTALAAFRETRLFEADKTILLGHSLGAVRAINMAAEDDQVDGLILLASAQLTRTSETDRGRNENRKKAVEIMRLMDTNGDSSCSEKEFSNWSAAHLEKHRALITQGFTQLDFFPDRQLVEWEISAGLARAVRAELEISRLPQVDPSGLRWTEDLLTIQKIDTLILYGTLDEAQSHHAPIISDLIKSKHLDHVKLVLVPGVGHQLGPEKEGLLGPISKASLKAIENWLLKIGY